MALSRQDVFPSMPSKAGRCGPFRAPDTDPSLGKGTRGICASRPMPLLSSACSWKHPLSPHLSVGHGLLGHFFETMHSAIAAASLQCWSRPSA